MLSSDVPSRFPRPFANDATGTYKRTIPTLASAAPAAGASLELGFPPTTFGPSATPPDGRDWNGILFRATAWARWQAAGGAIQYDSAFSTAIGGYPKYAILASTTVGILWQSSVEGNTTDPDGGSPAGWQALIPAFPSAAVSADIIAGTSTTKYATPKALKDAASSIDGQSTLFPDGRIHKSGSDFSSFLAGGLYSILFATAFPNACTCPIVVGVNTTATVGADVWIQIVSWTAAGFSFTVQDTNTGSVHFLQGVTWMADGN